MHVVNVDFWLMPTLRPATAYLVLWRWLTDPRRAVCIPPEFGINTLDSCILDVVSTLST
jgi:hypothetical protein